MGGLAFNAELIVEHWWRFVTGLEVTAELVGLSFCLGFLLAWALAMARMRRPGPLAASAMAYIVGFRGTPLLCQLYLVYYGAGQARPFLTQSGLWPFLRDPFYCCVLTFTLNTAAYQAEILRGALLAVAKEQREAAAALGLSRWRILRHVVLPQAMLIALRPLGNELVGLIKASALAAIVTLLDLMGQTRLIFARTFDFSAYFYAALIYLAAAEVVRRLCLRIERSRTRHLRVSC